MTCLPASPPEQSSCLNEAAASKSAAAEEMTRAIESLSIPRVLPADRVLFRDGDRPEHLYLLEKGQVIFTINSFGQQVPCFIVEAGSLIGLSATFADAPFVLTSTASPDAEVREIASGAFIKLIEGHAEWYLCIIRLLAEETHRAQQALAERLGG